MKSIIKKPVFLLLISLIVITGCKKKPSSSSSDVTSDSSSTSNSGGAGVIDWSKNEYYSALTEEADDINELAHLLRKTLIYQSYGDARYNYAVDSKTGFQYVLYETTGLEVTLDWGNSGYAPLTNGTTLKIEREHIWPQSNMKIRPVPRSQSVSTFPTFELDSDSSFYNNVSNSSRGHHTDWHNLWNAVGRWNGSHSNTFYGAPNLNHSQKEPQSFSSKWYPGAEFVGDVARAAFYMTLTYPFLTLVDSSSSNGQGSIYYGYLDYLLNWNEIDPVSPEEIDRNNKIFAKQKNRNPFIDFYDQDIASYIFSKGDPEVPQIQYT